MTKLQELEKVGRQAWLATIGTYAKGWEVLSGKVNETFEDTNKLINDLVENGEKIESELKEKIKSNTQLDSTILALKVKLNVEENLDDKLALLNKKVDQLSVVIEKLAEAKEAEIAKVKAAPALTEEVKKAPAKKRTTAKKVGAKTETAPVEKTTRARRTTAKTKPVEVK